MEFSEKVYSVTSFIILCVSSQKFLLYQKQCYLQFIALSQKVVSYFYIVPWEYQCYIFFFYSNHIEYKIPHDTVHLEMSYSESVSLYLNRFLYCFNYKMFCSFGHYMSLF